jgi:chaperonin cofactor prefoldin
MNRNRRSILLAVPLALAFGAIAWGQGAIPQLTKRLADAEKDLAGCEDMVARVTVELKKLESEFAAKGNDLSNFFPRSIAMYRGHLANWVECTGYAKARVDQLRKEIQAEYKRQAGMVREPGHDPLAPLQRLLDQEKALRERLAKLERERAAANAALAKLEKMNKALKPERK